MKLIDADMLIRDINADPYRTESEKSYDRCLVHRQPTVDAAPVVHGRWVDNGIPESILSACSVCDFPTGAYTFNFCPNCGAKMDGGENDDR